MQSSCRVEVCIITALLLAFVVAVSLPSRQRLFAVDLGLIKPFVVENEGKPVLGINKPEKGTLCNRCGCVCSQLLRCS